MPVRSIKNQYRGINAHLHSHNQSDDWLGFHTMQIVDLSRLLIPELHSMGYRTDIEESLQVQPNGDFRLKSDKLTVMDLIGEENDEHPYMAIAISPRSSDMKRGELVVWIEIIGSTTKRSIAHLETYKGRRRLLLDKIVVFVEIDLMHENAPTFETLNDYSQNQPDSYPYRIVVLNPRPNIKRGPAYLYEFGLETQIPIVEIPLSGEDKISFDYNIVYRDLFETGYVALRRVDYTELPLNFERYSPDDQRRIAARMLAVLEAARDGVDLESGPFEVKDITLEDALAQIETLKVQLNPPT